MAEMRAIASPLTITPRARELTLLREEQRGRGANLE